MITRITKANADKYRALFNDAVNALTTHDNDGNVVDKGSENAVIPTSIEYKEVSIDGDSYRPGYHYILEEGSDTWRLTELDEVFNANATYAMGTEYTEAINTLEDYFGYIEALQQIGSKEENGYQNKFTILPLDSDDDTDEKYFFIDANSRKITVPKPFDTVGIAVQGDEVAEILYFKINRFFDMDDLATKNILIEWRAPADAEGKRAEGLSVPWAINTINCPGYIIFGWPLSSELTANPGTIDFAVRFYTYNEDESKILYSFSTLMASAKINTSLNYNLEEILLDNSGIVDARDLIASRIVNSAINDASIPDPLEPKIKEYYITTPFGSSEGPISEDGSTPYYNIYLTDPENGTEQDGTYIIQATTNDTGSISYAWIKKDVEGELAQDSLQSSIIFEKVNDSERDFNKVYYQQTPGNTDVYIPYVFTEGQTLKEVEKLGIQLYERMSKVIINATGDDVLGSYQARVINRLGRKTERTYSAIALVNGPIAPRIDKDLTGGIFNAENTITLQVKAAIDEHAFTQYLFQKKNDITGDYELIETVKEPTYTVISEGYDGDGFYRVVVQSRLNSAVEEVEGEPLRITHAASPVDDIRVISGDLLTGGGYNINSPIEIGYTENPNEKRIEGIDEITCQWYKYGGTQATLAQDLEDAELGQYQVKNSDTKLEGANEVSIQIKNTPANEGGYYFCEITNKYNGTKAAKCSSFFNVIDTKA